VSTHGSEKHARVCVVAVMAAKAVKTVRNAASVNQSINESHLLVRLFTCVVKFFYNYSWFARDVIAAMLAYR
jgi:hypothetical protein